MSSDINQTKEEIISEFTMSNDGLPWLIIEGVTDDKFFATQKLPNTPKRVYVSGWKNVDDIIKEVCDKSSKVKACGFIDRDYREELDISVSCDDKIVVSDYKDLEISMFESEALNKFLTEYASKNKILTKEKQIDIDLIREKVYSIASIIGKIRFYILKNDLHISLTEIEYSKFFNAKNFNICNEKLMSHINSRAKNKKNKKSITIEEIECAHKDTLPTKLLDNKFICSGHDVIAILGEMLKKQWGNNNGKEMERQNLEKLFRIGYPNDVFAKTTMYYKLYNLLK